MSAVNIRYGHVKQPNLGICMSCIGIYECSKFGGVYGQNNNNKQKWSVPEIMFDIEWKIEWVYVDMVLFWKLWNSRQLLHG